jgi:hypothetical protein
MNQVDTIIQKTIATAEAAAINVIDKGEQSVLTVVDQAMKNIVRMIVIILLVVLLVVVGVLAWRGIIPKQVPQIVVTSVILVILFGSGGVLLSSDSAMGALFGTSIPIANAGSSITSSTKSYDLFITSTTSSGTRADLVSSSKTVLKGLLAAKYVAKIQADKAAIDAKISSMMVILYPPPKPMTVTPGMKSVPLGLSSKYYSNLLTLLNTAATSLKIKPEAPYLTPQKLDAKQPLLNLKVR